MPYDASDYSPLTAPRVRRASSRDLTVGVFSDGGLWKVYSEFVAARSFATRALAMQAGYALALEALDSGSGVQMFVQDEDGGFAQVAVEHGRPVLGGGSIKDVGQ